MGPSNHNSDDTTFVIVLVVLSMIILLAVPFCVWVYMETVEQRTMVEVSIRKFNKMQKQLEDERKKEKVNE
jgi:polyferredoxin